MVPQQAARIRIWSAAAPACRPAVSGRFRDHRHMPWPSLFPQKSSCNLGVNLTRTDAARAIVMLLSDSRVGMIEQGAGKVRRAPAIGRRG